MAKKIETTTKQAPATKVAPKGTKQAPAVTGARVGKLGTKQAPAKVAPKGKATAQASGQQAGRRSQFAGLSIRNLAPKGETPCRGGAAVRFDAIVAHRKVNDAIGSTYRIEGEADDRTINSADIAYLVQRGLIEVS